jgi:glyoxalase family protein
VAVNGERAGHLVEIFHGPDAPPARNGLGTVHHVALAISDPAEQLRVREELVRLGLKVTEVLDRQYFRSIYFREPGGVLFEIATIPPGFTVDEDLAHLGTSLKLPPWEGRMARQKPRFLRSLSDLSEDRHELGGENTNAESRAECRVPRGC